MFTGLIEEKGKISDIRSFDGGIEIDIIADKVISDLKIDHSISISGACQTVIKINDKVFTIQSIKETLEKTNFKNFKIGDDVNLERSLLPDTRLGGHFVQGHVNGTSKISHISNRGENWYIGINLSDELSKYCIKEGSITIDGISLTIADIIKNEIFVSIIPHTWQVTTMSNYKIGTEVNIEVDMFAKYIYKFLGNLKLLKD
ncbi:MAG: riboflavin synthase [Candidatus Sericytochromatia bacterium]|nr:riboflavin synthase [Candidatus Sericytochromatia bacterium]